MWTVTLTEPIRLRDETGKTLVMVIVNERQWVERSLALN